MPQISCVVCRVERETPVTKDGRPRTPRNWKVLRDVPHYHQGEYAAIGS